jgi:hypothetical protein
VVLALSRHGAPPAGGDLVVIAGTNLRPDATVTFGGVASPSVTVDPSVTGLVATTPAHAEGFVDVVVTNPDGQSSTVPGFHFGPPPSPQAFAPTLLSNGKAGQVVTIDGVDFDAGATVAFGTTPGAVQSRTPTQLTVLTPKVNPGFYLIVVTNTDGQFGVIGTLTIAGP